MQRVPVKKTKRKVVLKGSRMLPPKKSEDMYVTIKHLNAVEGKLSSQITDVLLKAVANNEAIHHLNKRVDSLKSEISSKFSKVEQSISELKEMMLTVLTKVNHTLEKSKEAGK